PARGGELVEEVLQRPSCVEPAVRVTVEGGEGGAGVAGADHAGARQPVRALGLEQVADDLEGAERPLALVGVGPSVVEPGEEGSERRGGPPQQLRGALEVEAHGHLRPGERCVRRDAGRIPARPPIWPTWSRAARAYRRRGRGCHPGSG